MDVAARYVEQVDRVLAAACELLPPPHQSLDVLEALPTPVAVPDGAAGLAVGVAAAAERYRTVGERVLATHDGVDSTVRGVMEAAHSAARTAAGIRRSAQVQAAALLPVANTPAGLRTLVDTMASALSSMQTLLSSTRAQMSASASQLRRHRDDWQGVTDA